MRLDQDLADWLLDTDPALRWQVQRDLLGEPEAVWRATRASIATEGMGARLLALQDADGQWAGGAYFPTRADPRAVNHPDDDEGQPYTATTWTLNTLREWGMDASALAGTAEKLAANSRWEYDDLPYWGGEVDCCINAFTLANVAWLGADVSGLVGWFLEHQQADGGWNCEWVEGSTRSSFHSTLNSLKGLLWYERAVGGLEGLNPADKEQDESIDDLSDCIDGIYDELDDIETAIDDEFDGEMDEDDFIEVVCPHCGETVYFDEDMIDSDDGLICPNCNETIEFEIPGGEEVED